jgi:hypothetical protein
MEPTIKAKPKTLSKENIRKYNFNKEDLTCRCCERVRMKTQFCNNALKIIYELKNIQSDYEKAIYMRKLYCKIKCNDCLANRAPRVQCYSCKNSLSFINFTGEQIYKSDRPLCKGCTIDTQEGLKSPKAESSEYEYHAFNNSSIPTQSKNDVTNQELFPVNSNGLNYSQHKTIDLTIDKNSDRLKNNMCAICSTKCSIHLCCRDCRNTMILIKFPRNQRDKEGKALCNICTKKSQENALSKLNGPGAIDLEIRDKKPQVNNDICTICESFCVKHLHCYVCMRTMLIKRFNEFQIAKRDKTRCKGCAKSEKKEMLEKTNSNSSPLGTSNNNLCSICKSNCSIHIYCCGCLETKSIEHYSANQKDTGKSTICKECEDNSQTVNEICSDSEKNNITSPSDSVNSFEIPDQTQDIETSNSVLVNKDDSLFINTPQDDTKLKDEKQEHLNICEPMSIPRFNKNIYSLSQLIGRKNPPVFGHIYTPFELPKEYESEIHDEFYMKENSTPFENLMLYSNDPANNQHNSQDIANDPSDIKEYVRQFVDSIYNHSLDQ